MVTTSTKRFDVVDGGGGGQMELDVGIREEPNVHATPPLEYHAGTDIAQHSTGIQPYTTKRAFPSSKSKPTEEPRTAYTGTTSEKVTRTI